jgi:hypothetical protein
VPTTTRRRTTKAANPPAADAPRLTPVPSFDQAHPPTILPTDDGQDILTSSPRLNDPFGNASPLFVAGDVSGTGPAPDTRTGTSSAGTTPPTAAEARRSTSRLLGVVVAITAGLAARALWRAGRAFREPSKEQIKDFADPVAAILIRHFDVSRINADLEDGVTALGVAGEWALEGPIAPRVFGPVDQIGMEQIPQADNPDPVTPAAPNPPDVWHQATRDPQATVTYQE